MHETQESEMISNNTPAAKRAHVGTSDDMSSSMTSQMPSKMMPSMDGGGGHMLSPMDPDSPMQWPQWKKIYVSFVAFSFAFVV